MKKYFFESAKRYFYVSADVDGNIFTYERAANIENNPVFLKHIYVYCLDKPNIGKQNLMPIKELLEFCYKNQITHMINSFTKSYIPISNLYILDSILKSKSNN